MSLPAKAGTGSAEIIVMSKLSIIMPVLNEGEGIAAALDALAVLRALGTEVMVVDGGSRDATIQRARLRADHVIAAPRGRALQMNAGADKASGDVLLFLHADTRLPADADHVVLNSLERSGRVWGHFDVEIEGQSPLLVVIAWLMNLRSRLTGIATGDQAMFVRRDAFQAAGGFAAIPLMEDIELCRRLRRVSRPLCLRERVITSGRRWEKRRYPQHRRADVAPPARLFPRRRSESAGAALRLSNEPVAVAVLAKAPIAGFAKTRLIPVLGARGAAVLQERLIERAVETACAAAIGPVTLWTTPDESHPVFQSIGAHLGITLARQADGDLGARMLAAIAAANARVLLIGSDCPALTSDHLRAAADVLRDRAPAVVDSGGRRRLCADRLADTRACAVLGHALEHAPRHERNPPQAQDARPDVARAGHAVGCGPPAGSRANARDRPA